MPPVGQGAGGRAPSAAGTRQLFDLSKFHVREVGGTRLIARVVHCHTCSKIVLRFIWSGVIFKLPPKPLGVRGKWAPDYVTRR